MNAGRSRLDPCGDAGRSARGGWVRLHDLPEGQFVLRVAAPSKAPWFSPPFELRAHVTGGGFGVPRPRRGGLERRELAHALARLLGVVVVQRRGQMRLAVPSPHVKRVEAVAAQREAVLLKHMAGFTLAEVSERLGCTPAATAGLLYRGRQRLQELLGEKS